LGSMNSSLDDRKEKGGDSEIANRDIHLFTYLGSGCRSFEHVAAVFDVV
jgi:hypothetical protein